jgi:branched-chain amino acid transport system permease protein
MGKRVAATAAFALLAIAPLLVGSNYVMYVVIIAVLFAFVTTGMNLIFGFAGQHAFGHPVFFGVGAYTSALLTVSAGLPVAFSILLSVVSVGLVSTVVAFPCLRLRGLSFGMATLAFGYVIYTVVQNWVSLTRGPMGIPAIPPLSLAPAEIGLSQDQQFHLVLVALLAATVFLLDRLISSPTGRGWIALRENEALAVSVGVRPFAYNMGAFIVGAMISGLGGALFAHYVGFVGPTEVGFSYIITAMIMLIAGGTGTLAGPIVGAIVFGILPELLRFVDEARNLVLGGILLASITFLPEGLVGIWARLRSLRRQAAPALPSAISSTLQLPVACLDPNKKVAPLEIREVSKGFEGLIALDGISFTVSPGEILGIIGPNGAGKTTLFNVITGFYKPSNGSIHLGETTVSRLPPAAVAAHGVVRTFQATSIFNGLSVQENVRTATHLWSIRNPLAALIRTARFRAREQEIERAVDFTLALVGLASNRHTLASALSYGDQRHLELAIAIASGCRHLLLDEPAAGLNPAESNRLRNLLRQLRDLGFTITLIEHDMKLVMELCDRIVVLNYGRKIAEGTPAEVARNPEVVEAYLGGELDNA